MVAQILPFRTENRKFLDPIWNKHHMERVEIVLKETLDVKGDPSFHQIRVFDIYHNCPFNNVQT